MSCWQTMLIDGHDVQDYAYITSVEGLWSNGPFKGDLIEQDWRDGALWRGGPRAPHTFEVPLLMRDDLSEGQRTHQLRWLQAWEGQTVTLTRRLVDGLADVSETCQAVVASAVQIDWNFESRRFMRAVMVFQTLSPWAAQSVIP
jgi:hypothetical protein